MEWLAVRYKNETTLFLQNRSERETSNSAHIDLGMVINTIVVKTFNEKSEAKLYIQKINIINKLLDNL